MSFISTLSKKELNILRTIVKRVNFKHYPKEFVTNWEADKFIDNLAPETVDRLMKVGVDNGVNSR